MHELGMIGVVAVVCGVLAWRADEKAVRWFFIGACLLSLLGGLVAAQEGNFWKSKPKAETAADKAQNECAMKDNQNLNPRPSQDFVGGYQN